MNSAEIAGLLEVIASERPDLLGPVVATLKLDSDSSGGLQELASSWEVRSPTPASGRSELFEVALKAARDLDRLEKRRGGWRHPREVVEEPNLTVLYSFTLRRIERSRIVRGRRLRVLASKLERAYEGERQRRMIEAFIYEPVPPVDPDWLRNFLGLDDLR